jgi:predicted nuclease with TOPRIM domain
MKWLVKLQENNIEESKLNKKITAKINEYKDADKEIKQLDADRSQISSEDIERYACPGYVFNPYPVINIQCSSSVKT